MAMTQSSERMHGGTGKQSRVQCVLTKKKKKNYAHTKVFEMWFGADRNIIQPCPLTLSHQTSHSIHRHPHLFHWSSDSRNAEAPYGSALLLPLPLGWSSWPASPSVQWRRAPSLFQLSTLYIKHFYFELLHWDVQMITDIESLRDAWQTTTNPWIAFNILCSCCCSRIGDYKYQFIYFWLT